MMMTLILYFMTLIFSLLILLVHVNKFNVYDIPIEIGLSASPHSREFFLLLRAIPIEKTEKTDTIFITQ